MRQSRRESSAEIEDQLAAALGITTGAASAKAYYASFAALFGRRDLHIKFWRGTQSGIDRIYINDPDGKAIAVWQTSSRHEHQTLKVDVEGINSAALLRLCEIFHHEIDGHYDAGNYGAVDRLRWMTPALADEMGGARAS